MLCINTNKIAKTIEINRNTVGRLLAIRNGKLVDLEGAMKYSLALIPLSICNLDGTMRRISKSVLMKITLTNLYRSTQLDIHVDSWCI